MPTNFFHRSHGRALALTAVVMLPMVTTAGCAWQQSLTSVQGLVIPLHRRMPPPIPSLPPCTARIPKPLDGNEPLPRHVTLEFDYREGVYAVSVDVPEKLYDASRYSATSDCYLDDENIDEFYNAMIEDPSLHRFFEELISQLRTIRDAEGLDDDEYAELMVAYVQSLEYCEGDSGRPKYPVALLADGCGDCDERSMLLAGLLAREGYDVALLLFEQHMGVGLASKILDYEGTGYAYIETTLTSLIGWEIFELTDGRSVPRFLAVVPLERVGDKSYGRGKQIRYLKEAFQSARDFVADRREDDVEQIHRLQAHLKGMIDTGASPRELLRMLRNLSPVLDFEETLTRLHVLTLAYLVAHQHDPEGAYNWVIDMHNLIAELSEYEESST